jgi:hypothetical protein
MNWIDIRSSAPKAATVRMLEIASRAKEVDLEYAWL